MGMHELYDKFPDVAPAIITKTELVRVGETFSKAAIEAFNEPNDILFKGFWLFSYDRGEPVLYGEKIPAFIRLQDGSRVQQRTYKNSPYLIDYIDGKFMLCDESGPLEEVGFEIRPRYFNRLLPDGTPMGAIVQCTRDLLFITLNKYCEMFRNGNQCLYCDFNAQTKAQKKGGEALVVRKDPEVVADVLEIAFSELRFRHIFITGGTILSTYKGKSEIEYYCEHLNTIRKRLKVWYPAHFQCGAQTEDNWKRIHDTGVGAVEPNMEVWDKRLFEIICPGKAKFIGYDEWIKRTIKAVDFFGPENVVPNFVTGVEMAKPMGFETVSSALKSTLGGWDFLMSHGVIPRMDMWCIEPGSKLAEHNLEPPPLEYYIEVEKGYLELREKHGFMTLPSLFDSRAMCYHNCMTDWEYYHGSGPRSLKSLNKKREDEEGNLL